MNTKGHSKGLFTPRNPQKYVGDLNHIVYLIRDLFTDQKGIIYCKKCMHNIPASKIRKDQTPAIQVVNNQIIEHLREKSGFHKSVEFSNIGRTKFLCNKKHELFGLIDWQ